jgi:hypothetical protein
VASAQPLDDGCVRHAAALTHRLQAVPAAALFKGVDQGGHDAGTASAQRVADGNSPAVDVGAFQDARLLPIYVLGPGQHDGPKRRHGIASAHSICPSKPSVFAMSR